MIDYEAELHRLCNNLGECQQKVDAMLHHLQELEDEMTANKLENLMLQDKLNEWIKCCDMFFHVAGKPERESWDQFIEAAKLYQQLKRSQLVEA